MEETQDQFNQVMEEHYAELSRLNKIVDAKNKRLLTAIKSVLGKSFVRNLLALLEECEVGSQLGVSTEFEIVRQTGSTWVSERYGRKIAGYWVDQWAIGDSGDSFEGYIYVELKPNRYLKASFSC